MHEDKNPRGLLLLRLWFARFPAEPCLQLRQYGIADDRSHKVIIFPDAK